MRQYANLINILISLMSVITSYLAATSLGALITALQNGIRSSFAMELGLYLFCVSATAILTVLLSSFIQNERSHALSAAWKKYLPRRIFHWQKSESESFFLSVTEQIPRCTELKLSMYSAIASAIGVFVLVGYAVYINNFYIAVLPLIAFSILGVISNGVLKKRFGMLIKSYIDTRKSLLEWNKQFFTGGDSLFFNHFNSDKLNYEDFVDAAITEHNQSRFQMVRATLLRNLVRMSMTDLPFFGLIGFFIWAGFQGMLSTGQVVSWIFLAQLMIQANNGLRAYQESKLELESTQATLKLNLARFTEANRDEIDQAKDSVQDTFTLKDESTVTISKKAGLFRIEGGNGSGKSTLLRTLRGSESIAFRSNSGGLSFSAESRLIRVIESEPYFLGKNDPVLKLVIDPEAQHLALSSILSAELVNAWQQRLAPLIEKGQLRAWSTLSSGEKALLQFLRCLHEPQDHMYFFIDEADAFYDSNAKELFRDTLEHLAKKHTIYLIQHESNIREFRRTQTVNSYMFGCSEDLKEGFAVPFCLKAVWDNRKQVHCFGNLGKALQGTFEKALASLDDQKFGELKSASFFLEAEVSNAKVGGTDSAGLALAIALVELNARLLNKKPSPTPIAGTGMIKIDGSIQPVAGLEAKAACAKKVLGESVNFLTPARVTHVRELAGLI